MKIQVKKEAKATVITITHRLDAVTSSDYGKKIHELIEGGEIRLVIDFTELEYISSAGLRELLVTAKLLKAKGGEVRCANVHGSVREVFDISGFNSIFSLDDSVAAALAEFL